MLQETLTAVLFYMPFVLTIAFGLFIFCIGIITFLSGTFLIVLFAFYGIYCILRDSGILTKWSESLVRLRKTVCPNILSNLQKSFLLVNPENIPSRNAFYICSPHGLVGYSWFFHFSFCLSEWPSSSPRPLLAIHSIFFRIPIARELLLANRCIEASETSILKALQKGHSVALILGGVEEMFHAGDKIVKLVVKKRKGYVRLAKQANVPLVPIFTEGEISLLGSEDSWLWKQFSSLMYACTHLQFPLPKWNSVKHFATLVNQPLNPPVSTFVLNAIETQDKEESILRTEYITRLTDFFKEKSMTAQIVA